MKNFKAALLLHQCDNLRDLEAVQCIKTNDNEKNSNVKNLNENFNSLNPSEKR